MLAPRIRTCWSSVMVSSDDQHSWCCARAASHQLSSVLQGIQTRRGFWLRIRVTALSPLTLTRLLTLRWGPVKLLWQLCTEPHSELERKLPKGHKVYPLHRSTVGRAPPIFTGSWHCHVFDFRIFLKHLGELDKSLRGDLRWSLTKRLGTISWILSGLKKSLQTCLLGVLMMPYSGDFVFVTLENLNSSWLPKDPSRCKPHGSSQWRLFWFEV